LISSISEIEQKPEFVESLRSEVSKGLTEKYNWDSITDRYLQAMRDLMRGNLR
jgi:hypothetical protein